MITLSPQKPHIRVVPKFMRPFVKAGKVDRIFRPRIFANGVFATATGYGVSFSVGGIDSEGLDRLTLDHVSKQIAIGNRMVPEECIVYEYLITAKNDELPGRAIKNEVVRQQAQERTEFLKANAKFKRAADRHVVPSGQSGRGTRRIRGEVTLCSAKDSKHGAAV